MARTLTPFALASLLSVTFAATAQAHVCMDTPASRVGAGCNFASPQKNGPCGVTQRSAKPTEFKPGQTITVSLNETIDHDSHYRIAFNPNGDTFEDPTSVDDKSGGHPNILLDGIKDDAAAKQSIQVTLPNITCDNCTLQLIQVMYDKGGNGFGGKNSAGMGNDDIYYACADIVLKGTAVGGSGDAGSGDIAAPRDAGTGGTNPGSDAGNGITKPAVDSGTPTSGKPDAAIAQEDAGADDGDDDDDDDHADHDDDGDEPATSDKSSDGGCSVGTQGSSHASSSGWLAFGLSLLALAARRRRV